MKNLMKYSVFRLGDPPEANMLKQWHGEKNTVYCQRVYILKVSDIKLHTYAYRWHMYAKSNANQPLVWSSYIIIISQSRFFPERSSQFFSEVQMDSHQNLHDQKKCKAHLQIRPALPILVTGIRLKASESVAPGRSGIFVVKLTEVFLGREGWGLRWKRRHYPAWIPLSEEFWPKIANQKTIFSRLERLERPEILTWGFRRIPTPDVLTHIRLSEVQRCFRVANHNSIANLMHSAVMITFMDATFVDRPWVMLMVQRTLFVRFLDLLVPGNSHQQVYNKLYL